MVRTSAPRNDCRQPVRNDPCCPDCGALQCLCRPRFFAGQLLSEKDLNRLDQYIRNKNQLHVRNLHGWGVVNGLLVLCDPCGDVKVTQGYAVDPCGNDIVVCEETRANLCELIRQCKQRDPRNDCQPFRAPPNTNCSDLEEEWVLAIAYEEWASQGITPLRGSSCGCGSNRGGSAASSCGCAGTSKSACSCGGGASSSKGSCGCGAGQSNAKAQSQVSARRSAPAQCEATVTCEGFSFSVYRKPEEKPNQQTGLTLSGAFWDAVRCCTQPLIAALPPMPTAEQSNNTQALAIAYARWVCRFRDNLIKHFQESRNASCEVLARLRAIQCPNTQSPNTFQQDLARATLELLAVWLEGLKNCLCLALLPPPPQNTCDLRVPLATVRVRARDCQVLSVCNWTTERKLLISWPAVTHWLGIVPIGTLLRELLDQLCCTSLLDLFSRLTDTPRLREDAVPAAPAAPGAAPAARAATTSETQQPKKGESASDLSGLASSLNLASGLFATHFSADYSVPAANLQQLMRGLLARQRKGEPLQLGALLNASTSRFALPENGQTLNTVERNNLPLVLLAETVVRPLMSTVLGEVRTEERMQELHAELDPSRKAAATTGAPDAGLRGEMDALRAEVAQQQAQIKALMSKLG